MARLGGLGKGLGALIPLEAGNIDGDAPRLVDLPIDSIIPNQHQPRVHFDEETLGELAASIREIGVLQPVLVRPIGDSAFELVAGERRWRAARRAGLAVIPAIVRNTNDLGLVERALVENLHRQDLTPLEEAAAYQQLIEDFELTHEQVANRVGKSRSAVTNTLRLMSLPPGIQHLLADGRLSAGHARALLGTPDRNLQEQLARQAVAENWSVRMLEEVVRERGDLCGEVVSARQEHRCAAPRTRVGSFERGRPQWQLHRIGVQRSAGDRVEDRVGVVEASGVQLGQQRDRCGLEHVGVIQGRVGDLLPLHGAVRR